VTSGSARLDMLSAAGPEEGAVRDDRLRLIFTARGAIRFRAVFALVVMVGVLVPR
jgi:hypothetical protein